MKLALKKLLQAHPSIQVSTLLSGSLTTPSAKGTFVPDTAFQSIQTVTVSSAVPSISFTSIPATFTHLQLRMILRSTDAGGNAGPILRMNSDSASNYNYHISEGNGSSLTSGGSANASFLTFGNCPAGATTAGTFASLTIDILDYADTNKFKTTRSLFGYDYNAGPYALVDLTGGTWRSTSAISTISLTMFTGSNFAQYSHAALYGILGS